MLVVEAEEGALAREDVVAVLLILKKHLSNDGPQKAKPFQNYNCVAYWVIICC